MKDLVRFSIAALAATLTATTLAAQSTERGNWRIGAATGSFVPRSAVIRAADNANTRLGAAPSFSLDVQYLASRSIAIYGDGTLAFSTLTLGSSIQPGVVGPSNQVIVLGGTAGVVLTPGSNLMGGHFQPTFRLGGGVKGYSFNLTNAKSQWRPTADFGLGFRGVGNGPIEVTVEARYLMSTFDQSKLPIRGIVPQDQRQSDLMFNIGVAIRP